MLWSVGEIGSYALIPDDCVEIMGSDDSVWTEVEGMAVSTWEALSPLARFVSTGTSARPVNKTNTMKLRYTIHSVLSAYSLTCMQCTSDLSLLSVKLELVCWVLGAQWMLRVQSIQAWRGVGLSLDCKPYMGRVCGVLRCLAVVGPNLWQD